MVEREQNIILLSLAIILLYQLSLFVTPKLLLTHDNAALTDCVKS